jgi:hypothetical protein
MTSLSPAGRRLRRPLLAAAGAALLVAGGAAVASAGGQAGTKLHCGSTITKSTTLSNDLVGCKGVGLRIGADGITLDLNGHTVAASAVRNPKAHGILNEGHAAVTIEGGTVTGFGAYGVRLEGADGNTVQDLHLVGNYTGIGLVQSDEGVLRRLDIAGARFVGVNLTGGRADIVRDNVIRDSNGPAVLVRPSVEEPGSGHWIAENEIHGNGIEVDPGPQSVRLVANTLEGGDRDGLELFEPSTVVGGNQVTGAHGRGIDAPNGVVDDGGNAASGNALDPQCVGVAC